MRTLKTETPNLKVYNIAISISVFLGTFSWLPVISPSMLNFIKYASFFSLVLLSVARFNVRMNKATYFLLIYALFLFPPLAVSVITYGSEQFSAAILIIAPFLITLALSKNKNFRESFIMTLKSFIAAMLVQSLWIIISYTLSLNIAPKEVVGYGIYLTYSAMGFTNSHTMVSPFIALSLGAVLLDTNKIFFGNIILLKYLSIAILAIALFLSTGEGGALVLLASLGCVIFARIIKSNMLATIITFSCAAAVFFIIGPYLSESLYSSYIEHMVSDIAGWNMFTGNPFFGVGPGKSYFFFNESIHTIISSVKLYSESLTPHTSYGVVTAENGVFGVGALVVLLTLLFKAIRKSNLSESEGRISYFILTYFFILSIIEPWPMVSNFFGLYIFYISIIYNTSSNTQKAFA